MSKPQGFRPTIEELDSGSKPGMTCCRTAGNPDLQTPSRGVARQHLKNHAKRVMSKPQGFRPTVTCNDGKLVSGGVAATPQAIASGLQEKRDLTYKRRTGFRVKARNDTLQARREPRPTVEGSYTRHKNLLKPGRTSGPPAAPSWRTRTYTTHGNQDERPGSPCRNSQHRVAGGLVSPDRCLAGDKPRPCAMKSPLSINRFPCQMV